MFDVGHLANGLSAVISVLGAVAGAAMVVRLWHNERAGVVSLFTDADRNSLHLSAPLNDNSSREIQALRDEAARIHARVQHSAMREQVRLAERDLDEALRLIEIQKSSGQQMLAVIAGTAVHFANLRLHAVHSAFVQHGAQAAALGVSARLLPGFTVLDADGRPSPYSVQSRFSHIAALVTNAAALGNRVSHEVLREQVKLAERDLAEAEAWLREPDLLRRPVLVALADAAVMLAGSRMTVVQEILEQGAALNQRKGHRHRLRSWAD